MEKNKLIINAAIPGDLCNLRCSYCYMPSKKVAPTRFDYSVEHMLEAFSKERLGGAAYILFCGGGETLLNDETIDLVAGCINLGHTVSVTSNGTLSEKIDLLLSKIPKSRRSQFIMKASFHYFELERIGKLNEYFGNINKIIAGGSSAYPTLIITEGLLEYIDRILEITKENLGNYPHATVELDFKDGKELSVKDFYTDNVRDLYKYKLNSPVFDLFTKMLEINPKKYFCYAGYKSFRRIQLASATPSKLNEKARWYSPLASPSNQRLRGVWAMHTLPGKNGTTSARQ